VLGVVENMSGYICPCCGERSNIFSTGGGEEMARQEHVPFLGSLPVDADLVALLDAAEVAQIEEGNGGAVKDIVASRGFVLWERYQKTRSSTLFKDIVDRVVEALA
jgi:hypothetical protein